MSREESLRSSLVERVVRETRARFAQQDFSSTESEAAAFAAKCLASLADADLTLRSAEQLAEAIVSLWHFGERRPARQALVRLVPTGTDATWLEIVQDDMPFLLDSVLAALDRHGLTIGEVLHPVVTVHRDADGRRLGLAETGGHRESSMLIEIEGAVAAVVQSDIEGVLEDVRAAVEDFPAIRARLAEVIAEAERLLPPLPASGAEEARADAAEERDFLAWLDRDHFVFLGACRFDLVVTPEGESLRPVGASAVGYFRRQAAAGQLVTQPLTAKMSEFAHRPQHLFVTKVRKRSTVHRLAQIDYIGVRRWNAAGKLVGEDRFYGLFTTAALRQRVDQTPLVARKAAWVRERAGFDPASHDGKALVDILETLPRGELFQFRRGELLEACLAMLRLDRRRVGFVVRYDPFDRFVSCLVLVPKNRFSDAQLARLRPILEHAYGSEVADERVQFLEGHHAQIHLLLKRLSTSALPARADVEAELADAVLTWSDRLRRQLLADPPPELAPGAARRYAEAFPTSYQERTSPAEARADLVALEQALETKQLATRLFRVLDEPANHVHFKIFNPRKPVSLSDVLPLLENLALRVTTEMPYEVRPAEGEVAWIHDFTLVRRSGRPFDLEALASTFPEAFARIWAEDCEDDAFNRLVTRAGLAWREVVVLRAYARYLRQASAASQAAMQRALAAYPGLARQLAAAFAAKFDPEGAGADHANQILDAVAVALISSEEKVTPDAHHIFDLYLDVLRATLRTNFYQRDADGAPKDYVSFKLDAGQLPFLAPPKQLFEVFVYSTRMEGIHLRGGKVARGGIRWSDRRDDFRTEILGLVKTQRVKNSVIVPVGSKGGFVLKMAPAATDREAFQREGIECYKLLIRGLLDITDNRRGEAIESPPRVVCHDGPDPYLVVAADKGTATFSNIANGLSLEYGHWLGDAFASGGVTGYDHKGMGITAKGGWEAVKRHFRELDPAKNIQAQEFTVVGVGDMSGDVFGNGMLLSEKIRLIAAFDHRHIFIDPNPDVATSFAERKRLFEKERSTWDDYERTLLSTGGGVWPRSQGAITLAKEAVEALDLKKSTVTPWELMRAILGADVELLWLGGIGTYVKASDETHVDAKDRVNDAVRLDATELRCKVIGEGANLGLTQRARIEFALRGGKINTDAIDNSAGVDTSDHEVNIKILFAPVVERGELTTEARNERIAAMTEEVEDLVLRDNYLQTQAVSLTEALGFGGLDAQVRLLRRLEREGKIDRQLEGLPDDTELAERGAKRQGLTRPELAVLLAYSKLALYDELVASRLVEESFFELDLFAYFPCALGRDFPADVRGHRLRREIIATVVTNELVNRVGPTFVSDLTEATGRSAADIAAAYAVARDSFGLRALWADIEALDRQIGKVPARTQAEMLRATATLIERVALGLLRAEASIDAGALVRELAPTVAELTTKLSGEEPKKVVRGLVRAGVDDALARRVARLEPLVAAVAIWRLGRSGGLEVGAVAPVFFAVGSKFSFDGLRASTARLAAGGRWPKAAAEGLIESFDWLQAEITRQVLSQGPAAASDRGLKAWMASRAEDTRRTLELLDEISPREENLVELAQMSVVEGALRRLVGG